jgi:hypothetical protein
VTRRGAVLAMLLAPLGTQNLTFSTIRQRNVLTLFFPEKPTDKMLEIRWSDGTTVTFTEAQIKAAL